MIGKGNTYMRVLCIVGFVHYDETNRELQRILEGSTRPDTRLHGGLYHPKIETRLRVGMFESVKGECVV